MAWAIGDSMSKLANGTISDTDHYADAVPLNIGYIVKNKKDQFRPFIGTPIPSEGDNDSFMKVLASGPSFSRLSYAQKFLQANSNGLKKISLEPVQSSSMGTWLSQLVFKETI